MSRRAAWLALVLAAPASASAAGLPFDCNALQAVVAEAPTRFNNITGSRRTQEDAAAIAAQLGVPLAQVDPDYLRVVESSDTPLRGAKLCEVVSVRGGDTDAAFSQTAHVCHFPGVTKLSAEFNAQLAQCLGRPSDPDADKDSVAIEIDTVVSGEGYANTEVTATVHPLDGLQLSVVQIVCQARRVGGCDDEDVD